MMGKGCLTLVFIQSRFVYAPTYTGLDAPPEPYWVIIGQMYIKFILFMAIFSLTDPKSNTNLTSPYLRTNMFQISPQKSA